MLWNVLGFIVIVLLFLTGAPIWLAMISGSIIMLVQGIGTSGTTVAVQYLTGVDTFTMMAIPFFMLAGNIMAQGGASQPIFNVMNSFLGRKKGGIPICVVLVSMVYAAITGSTVAALSAISSICLPIMRKAGYPDKYSAGLMVSSATLGQLIPPSLLMIVYGGLAKQDVSQLFISGIVPGVLCAAVLAVVAFFKCPSFESLTVTYPPETFTLQNRVRCTIKGIPALIMPVIILGSIYGGYMTPTEAAALSCVYGFLISIFVYRGLNWQGFKQTMFDTSNSNSMIFVVAGAALVFAQPLTRLGIPQAFAKMIAASGLQGSMLILAIAVILLVLGCFLDSMPILYLVIPIVLPALREAGISLIQFNAIVIVCMQIGQITPPFGTALYLGAKLTDVPVVELIKETAPYLIAMIVFLLALIFFPAISLCLL